MISKTSKILTEEHKNILKVIENLENEADILERGKEINKKFFSDAIDFIRNYADKFHHAKEEDILFKEFDKAAEEGCAHCNPTKQMLSEHDEGRKFVKGIEQGVKENNKNKVIENARGYCMLLKEHIYKEDNILYPMADESLNEKVKNDMLKKFEKVERERRKDKEKYLTFVKSLK
ncbi:MAG: hemerythrin domain-containing protein [Nanoarchaeota archaeon]